MMRQRLTDICANVISGVKDIHGSSWISSVCVISILVISILPVSIGRSESETSLCAIIPAIAFIGFVILFMRKIRFSFNWTDGIVFGWYAFVLLRLWLDATYPAAGFALRATLMCMLYVAIRLLFTSCRFSGKHIAVLLILFSIVEAWMGYSQLISGESRHHLYPVTGSFLNPGPYSACLALGIVTVASLRKIIDIGWFVIMFLAVPLALTMSRAAFFSIFICMAILYRNSIKGWKQWVLLFAIFLICGVCLYVLKEGSAVGRGMINYIGFHCFADKPLFGNGIGSFLHSFALKTAEISFNIPSTDLSGVDVIDYAFNDLLLVGVEQGLIGLTFPVTLIAIVMNRLLTLCRPLFLTALSLLVFSLFSYPFELLPYQIITVIITAYAASISYTGSVSANRFSRTKEILKAIAIILPIFLITHLCIIEIRDRLKAEEDYRMLAGLRDNAFMKDYYQMAPWLQENKRFLFDFAKILADERRYNDSNDMLRRGALISNDPMFLVLQGNNYRDMEAYDLAEEAYLRAWHTMPNRIYPLYRLMKLHEQTGNIEKAYKYAEKVINFKEKIKSPAVNDMKAEAYEIIN